MLDISEVKAILQPQFGDFLGKSIKGVPLWVHSFTLWSIVCRLLRFIPRFDEKEKRLLEITVLIHDIGKMTEKNQAILSGAKEGSSVRHTQNKAQIEAYLVDNGLVEALSLTKEDIDLIYHAHLHHNLPEDSLKTAPPAMAVYADIVRYADWLASMDRLDRQLVQRISGYLEPFCQMTTVHIGRPDGPSNYLLFDTAYKIYKESGWDILLVLSDGLLLISPRGSSYPEKSMVVRQFQSEITTASLTLQRPNPTNFAAVLLAGESAKNPRAYLEVHHDFIADALGDFDRAPIFFLKLLIEILDLSGKLTTDLKNRYPVLDILKGLCGTRGIPIARKKWQVMGGKVVEPLKEMLRELFGVIRLEQVLPHEFVKYQQTTGALNKIASDELYSIIYQLAAKLFPQKDDIAFQAELESLISMEEELDFRSIAVARLERYKEYKATQNPEKGVCESCGSTRAFSTQKSLNFPGGKRWGFSQISAHTDSARATCTLCAYDTMTLRKDIPEAKNPVYVRLESKSADTWSLYDEVAKLIQRLDASFFNPYTLETIDKNRDFGYLPLPKDFKMPKLKEPKYVNLSFTSIRGYLIPVTREDAGASPKDLRAKYMSLYALLLMMGFDAHIGFEEQSGLFGDKLIAKRGETYHRLYYRGLAVKWLANMVDKGNNAHVFAESLLNKSPSVAITKIGETASDDKKRRKIEGNQLPFIFETIIKGGFKVAITTGGGEYTMKDLLQDAAFFSENIPSFVWSGDDYKSWHMGSSKHLITKPISKTMNSILQGDDFETAFARYLSLIKENIAGDKTRDGSEAKVDVKDLASFVSKSKEILTRYYELRQQDISAFIQAKNALLSSVYLLKRYPNIKEAVNG